MFTCSFNKKEQQLVVLLLSIPYRYMFWLIRLKVTEIFDFMHVDVLESSEEAEEEKK